MEMMTFFAIVNIGVAISSTLFYFFLYMCTFNTDLLFFVRIHGLTGYISGEKNWSIKREEKQSDPKSMISIILSVAAYEFHRGTN
jgi:Eukaryotic integral membrane protein (DUF1751).